MSLYCPLGWIPKIPSHPEAPSGATWTSHLATTWTPPKWRFQIGWVFFASGTSTTPTRVPSTGFEWNEFAPCRFLKCCVSIYTSTLVSFLTKEFNNLTLMVALAKCPLGALSMPPKPSAIKFINLVISWFCVVASPCWIINAQKPSTKAKNSLDDFLHLWSFLFLFFKRSIHNQTF